MSLHVYYNKTQAQCMLYTLLSVWKRDETLTLYFTSPVLLCIT